MPDATRGHITGQGKGVGSHIVCDHHGTKSPVDAATAVVDGIGGCSAASGAVVVQYKGQDRATVKGICGGVVDFGTVII